jgi:hypothetical protein
MAWMGVERLLLFDSICWAGLAGCLCSVLLFGVGVFFPPLRSFVRSRMDDGDTPGTDGWVVMELLPCLVGGIGGWVVMMGRYDVSLI